MSEQLKILTMIENGEITPEEGAHMLENISEDEKQEKLEVINQIGEEVSSRQAAGKRTGRGAF